MELPGFYYDSEKKKYFRILSGSNTPLSHFVTKDFVKSKINESERLLEQNSITSKNNIIQLLDKRILLYDQINVRHQINNYIYKAMKWSKSSNLNRHFENIYSFAFNKDGFGIFVMKQLQINRIFLFFVDNIFQKSLMQNFSLHQLKNCCLSQIIIEDFLRDCEIIDIKQIFLIDNFLYILLYVFVTNMRYHESRLVKMYVDPIYGFNDLYIFRNKKHVGKSFSVSNFDDVAIMFHNCVYILDELGTKYKSIKRTVSSLDFFNQSPLKVVIGTYNYPMQIIDIRLSDTTPVHFKDNRSKKVCCLKVLSNDINILTSHFTGEIFLWDIRNMKIVQYFESYNNHGNIFFLNLNSNEDFFASIDECAFTRIWDMQDGKIIKLMEPPHDVHCKTNKISFNPLTGQICYSNITNFWISS